MSKLILDKDYIDWVADLSKRYRSSQIKAAVSVNEELLKFYWSLGHDIVERQEENKYGRGFFNTLSRDLKAILPEAKGLSVNNLYYIRQFYQMYSSISPQVEGKCMERIPSESRRYRTVHRPAVLQSQITLLLRD